MVPTEFYTYLYRDYDGTPLYVGKGRGNRAFQHIHLKTEFGELLRQRKLNGYELQPILVEQPSEDDAFLFEQELIALHGRRDKRTGTLFNRSDGGYGFRGVVTDEYRAKLSAALKGRYGVHTGKKFSNETKRKMSKAAKGKPKSAEHRAKMSESQKKRAVREGRRVAL